MDFWEYSNERERIRLAREAGKHRNDWTRDPILSEWSFCNIFREDDKTTAWFRENIRNPLRDRYEVLFATVAFRWFNRIETGEAILEALGGPEGFTPQNWDSGKVSRRLRQSGPPYVTGAYMIKTPTGMDKLFGVLECIENFERCWHDGLVATIWRTSLMEKACDSLAQVEFLGNFLAYEIITDLRHTCYLEKSVDHNTWANPGPGCRRGLARLHGKEVNAYRSTSRTELLDMMSPILRQSRDPKFWLFQDRRWEMREVEHTLCEFDKYLRVKEGGKLKRKYR